LGRFAWHRHRLVIEGGQAGKPGDDVHGGIPFDITIVVGYRLA
jgi:hypothetical protein